MKEPTVKQRKQGWQVAPPDGFDGPPPTLTDVLEAELALTTAKAAIPRDVCPKCQQTLPRPKRALETLREAKAEVIRLRQAFRVNEGREGAVVEAEKNED